MITCLLQKPIWTYFSGILCDFFNCLITMDEIWFHIYWSRDQTIIQGMGTVVLDVQRSSRYRSHKAWYWHLFWDKDGIFLVDYPKKGCNHLSKVLHCTSRQSEASIDLQKFRQAFKGNLVSSRQCFLHKTTIEHQIRRSSVWISEPPGLLTWFGPFGLLSLS
jgi:hypothetical protein